MASRKGQTGKAVTTIPPREKGEVKLDGNGVVEATSWPHGRVFSEGTPVKVVDDGLNGVVEVSYDHHRKS